MKEFNIRITLIPASTSKSTLPSTVSKVMVTCLKPNYNKFSTENKLLGHVLQLNDTSHTAFTIA